MNVSFYPKEIDRPSINYHNKGAPFIINMTLGHYTNMRNHMKYRAVRDPFPIFFLTISNISEVSFLFAAKTFFF